ncbi:hypothetical protein NDU88_004319 [Pleurodeles waltl]|uniref:Uncharacterized protein n=1 Tax=Pleurodeles waltl TaxID=8319 RepID=A0AAV7MT44_PLEWA|nr:hypothetical protein NDU88_004319 [Pleurodeles waltl]
MKWLTRRRQEIWPAHRHVRQRPMWINPAATTCGGAARAPYQTDLGRPWAPTTQPGGAGVALSRRDERRDGGADPLLWPQWGFPSPGSRGNSVTPECCGRPTNANY